MAEENPNVMLRNGVKVPLLGLGKLQFLCFKLHQIILIGQVQHILVVTSMTL